MAVSSPYAVFKASDWAWLAQPASAPSAPHVMVTAPPPWPRRKPQKRLSSIVQGELFQLA